MIMIIMALMIIATYTTYDYNDNYYYNYNREPLGEPAFRRRTGRRQRRGLVNINLQIFTLCRVALFDKGNRLLEINPDLLIIVEGILSAGNLMGALIHPIELSRPEKLVYSGLPMSTLPRPMSTQATSTPSAPSSRTWTTLSSSP